MEDIDILDALLSHLKDAPCCVDTVVNFNSPKCKIETNDTVWTYQLISQQGLKRGNSHIIHEGSFRLVLEYALGCGYKEAQEGARCLKRHFLNKTICYENEYGELGSLFIPTMQYIRNTNTDGGKYQEILSFQYRTFESLCCERPQPICEQNNNHC